MRKEEIPECPVWVEVVLNLMLAIALEALLWERTSLVWFGWAICLRGYLYLNKPPRMSIWLFFVYLPEVWVYTLWILTFRFINYAKKRSTK